jgi:molybdenum cofactor synthesis domain-containing protein
MSRIVTAAVLLIGDEILSGRTQDTNLRTIAQFLAPLGVEVREARVVPDIQDVIVATLNHLRATYDYVFTTGGIGPTHDDITADAVAAAFGVGIDVRPDALAILTDWYKGRGTEMNPARLRMARIPDGADLILNPVSGAPGFQIGNVFTMAGVPAVMRGMLEDIPRRIQGGAVVLARTVKGKGMREGDIAAALGKLAQDTPAVSFGSYPWMRPGAAGEIDYGVALVARGRDPAAMEAAGEALAAIVRGQGIEPEIEN